MLRRPLLLLGALALLGAVVVLRFWTRSDLWFDEALSVNIASLPISDIPDALRQDGHPPLYYFLLHFWMEVVGSGDFAVRALSGVLSLATLPLAWFAGKRVGGRTAAWCTVLVIGLSPYAFRYATEARMYALIMLFVTGGYLALRRSLETPSLARLAIVTAITAGLVLTQYWDLYLVAVVAGGLAYRWRRASDPTVRRAAGRAFLAVATGALAFVPWLPVFVDQFGHTGTPWGDPQFPWVVAPRTLIAFAGNEYDGEAYLLALAVLLLSLLAIFGRGLDPRRIELDLHTRPHVRWEAAAALGVLLLGSAVSYVTDTTIAPRYSSTIFPLVALVVAYGVLVFLDERVRLGVVVVLAVLGIAGGLRNVTYERTQAGRAAEAIQAESRPGDVVAYCSDQLGPDVSRLLRDVEGLGQITFPDQDRPEFVNWRDYLARVDRADPAEFASDAIERAGSNTVWFVWSSGVNHLERACAEISEALNEARDPNIRVFPDDNVLEVRALTEYRAG